jgi:hypothetical protein
MENPINTKINMFKAVEQSCFSFIGIWETNANFGSLLSKFALKVAQLDLLLHSHIRKSTTTIQQLLSEIEQLLERRMDTFVFYLNGEQPDFVQDYTIARRI